MDCLDMSWLMRDTYVMTFTVTADSSHQRYTNERAAIAAARTIRGSARYTSVTVKRNDVNRTVVWTERDW